MGETFRRWAAAASRAMGTTWAFFGAVATVLAWAAAGPLLHFSETWQLVINTGTTIVTFLMVILLQNAQNRETAAMQLKLDELLWAVSSARTGMVKLENLSDEELADLQKQFEKLRKPQVPSAPGRRKTGRG